MLVELVIPTVAGEEKRLVMTRPSKHVGSTGGQGLKFLRREDIHTLVLGGVTIAINELRFDNQLTKYKSSTTTDKARRHVLRREYNYGF